MIIFACLCVFVLTIRFFLLLQIVTNSVILNDLNPIKLTHTTHDSRSDYDEYRNETGKEEQEKVTSILD